ncbi:hypothetical protein L6452_42211 [Arctium lappa]|uniref:Uncharacterized protein n=1 Tax=Arctium lappa TaxID=4217 RepID=A0ACB8XI78_ARCLA|nr:hypothetical protein L6452_42211 [Arctium lappa]
MDIGSRLSSVLDVSRKKLSHMAILRDVVRLENQIPLFLIKTMMEHDRISDEPATDTLRIMLMGLYHELSPFQYQHQSPCVDINDCDHLLDFLYHMTVPNAKELGISTDVHETTIDVIKTANFGFLRLVKNITFSRPIKLVMKLSWKIISSLPILKLFKEPIDHMLANLQGETNEKEKEGTDKSNPPLIEEITIPSVTEMVKAEIFFSLVNGSISEIRFNKKTSTLYLPVVHLDVNTEVYLRNLVAYEACVASGPLIMVRYTELMNGIIDTAEDAKYLMDCRILYNRLKSEKEVADLWNGMSKCVKMTKVPFMDKAIEEVNKRYEQTWRVKIGKFMSKFVFGSWKFLTLLAAMFLLFLSTVQTFCSVYSCARVFRQLPELDEPQ